MFCQPRVSSHHSKIGHYADTSALTAHRGSGVGPLPHVATPTTPITHLAQVLRVDLLVTRLRAIIDVRTVVVGLGPLGQAVDH
jgi:hypothetical protein